MLGIELTGRDAVPHGLPLGADPRPVRPEDVEDEGQRRRPARGHGRVRRRRPAVRPDPRRDARPGPAVRAARSSRHARNFANKLWNATRFVLGARPASIAEDAERPAAIDDALLGPTERWIRSRAAATTAAVDRASRSTSSPRSPAPSTTAIWSEFCDWGIELAKVRLADGSLRPTRARRLVDARRRARHVPSAAPPGHALRDRGHLGLAAAPRGRRGPADRRPLAGARTPRTTRSTGGWPRRRDDRRCPERPRDGRGAGRRLARDPSRDPRRGASDLRGAGVRHRPAGACPAAEPPWITGGAAGRRRIRWS